jgi:beta-glucosidase
MTITEKARMCTGATPWMTEAIPRLGVSAVAMADGPHGVRKVAKPGQLGAQGLPATCFPTASCLASSWDVDLLRRVGKAIAIECKTLSVDVLLGPGVNIKRAPVCGRNFEYYSEDPYLSGELGASFIQGVQGEGVGTSLKHFTANNQEFQRFIVNAMMDERTLREIYLPAFEIAVKKGKPWTVMCAYNKVNGVYCSEHFNLATEILKGEWEFDGVLVSDWGAVHDRVAALNAGLDLEMPGPKEKSVQEIIQAVENGSLDEDVLDDAVARLLRMALRVGATPNRQNGFDPNAHHTLAKNTASEGMVLLKNVGHFLPLKDVAKLAVIGRAAKEPRIQGGGSSQVNPTRLDTPFNEIKKIAKGSKLAYAEGYGRDYGYDPDLIVAACQIAKGAQVALLFIDIPLESEGYDRQHMDLPEQSIALIEAVTEVQPKTVVILNIGSPVRMGNWLQDTPAVLIAWLIGQGGGKAVADILFGNVNPSGKLAETFPLKLRDTPAFLNFPGENRQVNYSERMFIGYRYYDAKEMPVQYHFGYGLSYTTFKYSNPRVSAKSFRDIDRVTVSVDITNTGNLAGKEIVQIYVHDCESSLIRPPKELKGFVKVSLEPGETKMVAIDLDQRAFAYYHPGYQCWFAEKGEFELLIGSSSHAIHFREKVTLHSTMELPSLLDSESTLREWFEDPVGAEVSQPLFEQLMTQASRTIGGGDGGGITAEMLQTMADMPLLSILNFIGDQLPKPPEEMVDELLGQIHKKAL